MKPEVAAQFPGFTERFEGHCSWLYCDVKGLVTTGRGNLVDASPGPNPEASALVLPWLNADGSGASHSDIEAAWHAVKARQDLKLHGGGAYKLLTTIRLSEAAIDALTTSKMLEMESELKARFAGWEDMPAPAQLGVLSMAWACGPAFHFPKFEAALRAGDFYTCALECRMDETGNPGLIPRNAANRALFLKAAGQIVTPSASIAFVPASPDTTPDAPNTPDDPTEPPEAA